MLLAISIGIPGPDDVIKSFFDQLAKAVFSPIQAELQAAIEALVRAPWPDLQADWYTSRYSKLMAAGILLSFFVCLIAFIIESAKRSGGKGFFYYVKAFLLTWLAAYLLPVAFGVGTVFGHFASQAIIDILGVSPDSISPAPSIDGPMAIFLGLPLYYFVLVFRMQVIVLNVWFYIALLVWPIVIGFRNAGGFGRRLFSTMTTVSIVVVISRPLMIAFLALSAYIQQETKVQYSGMAAFAATLLTLIITAWTPIGLYLILHPKIVEVAGDVSTKEKSRGPGLDIALAGLAGGGLVYADQRHTSAATGQKPQSGAVTKGLMASAALKAGQRSSPYVAAGLAVTSAATQVLHGKGGSKQPAPNRRTESVVVVPPAASRDAGRQLPPPRSPGNGPPTPPQPVTHPVPEAPPSSPVQPTLPPSGPPPPPPPPPPSRRGELGIGTPPEGGDHGRRQSPSD